MRVKEQFFARYIRQGNLIIQILKQSGICRFSASTCFLLITSKAHSRDKDSRI